MSHHNHAIVWIDHLEARIFHFNASEVDRLVLHPHDPTHHIHHKANSIGSGHAVVDQNFLQLVTNTIADTGAVLITGPGLAKADLVKHIATHAPAIRDCIVGVETVDHPTDGELVAHARKHFKADHQAPPRQLK